MNMALAAATTLVDVLVTREAQGNDPKNIDGHRARHLTRA